MHDCTKLFVISKCYNFLIVDSDIFAVDFFWGEIFFHCFRCEYVFIFIRMIYLLGVCIGVLLLGWMCLGAFFIKSALSHPNL